ncbi:MAG: FAD-binding protein [Opitutus sp.]|nr:FAD-binding protein [Opitutus sp.]
MTAVLSPVTPAELADAVRSAPRVLAVGGGTKPRMSRAAADVVKISTVKLRGVVEYEPSEFTFTALAGTPVREIVATLGERGQYLPFDPLFSAAGATLGGTLASGVSGPGRFRFGGLRDFVLGVRFVDGGGRLLRLGGKVVKNAAGFDLPKFFVGSVGRFGALAEVTFKVFPRPLATRTLRLDAKNATAMTEIFTAAGSARWELDALDASPGEGAVYARLAAPAPALDALAKEILSRWPGTVLADNAAAKLWSDVVEAAWAHAGGTLVKFALTPSQVPEFVAGFPAVARGWVSAGGNVGYLSLPAGAAFPSFATATEGKPAFAWPAVTLRGDVALWPGAPPRFEVMRAVKIALDPQNRFPNLDD